MTKFCQLVQEPGAIDIAALYAQCDPALMHDANVWHQFASIVRFRHGADTSNWRFKDPATKNLYLECIEKVAISERTDDRERIRMKNIIVAQLMQEALKEMPPTYLRSDNRFV